MFVARTFCCRKHTRHSPRPLTVQLRGNMLGILVLFGSHQRQMYYVVTGGCRLGIPSQVVLQTVLKTKPTTCL